MMRGDIWQYNPVINRPGVSTQRLIIGADEINVNPDLKIVLTLQIFDFDPGGLLSVEIVRRSWASVLHPEATVRSRLTELLDVVKSEMMNRVSAILRAAFDL